MFSIFSHTFLLCSSTASRGNASVECTRREEERGEKRGRRKKEEEEEERRERRERERREKEERGGEEERERRRERGERERGERERGERAKVVYSSTVYVHFYSVSALFVFHSTLVVRIPTVFRHCLTRKKTQTEHIMRAFLCVPALPHAEMLLCETDMCA